jgi:hypothetical protein
VDYLEKSGKVVKTVTQINNIHENAVVQTGQRSGAKTAAGFQDSLETALAKESAGKTESGQAAALGEPQAAHFNPAPSPAGEDIVCQTDSLLGLLESYSKGLESPDATLKDLAPLVDRIRDEAQQLAASADSDTAATDELRDIASQAALTANIECIKFQRGDYV